MEDSTIVILLVILAPLLLGIGNTFARVGLQSVKATSATILSLITGLIVALIITLGFEFEDLVSVSLVAVGWFALVGVVHFALGKVLLYQTMRYIGAARGISVAQSYPVFALIFAVIFLGETITIPIVTGTLLIVGGIYVLLSDRSETRITKKNRVLGYCSGLATALIWGVAVILIKHSSQFGSPFVILSFALLSGVLVLSAATGKDFEIGIKTNRRAIGSLLLAGFLGGGGLASFYVALAMAPVVVVAPISATSPLFTIIGVRLFLQRLERITLPVLIGSLLVVAGGVLVAIY